MTCRDPIVPIVRASFVKKASQVNATAIKVSCQVNTHTVQSNEALEFAGVTVSSTCTIVPLPNLIAIGIISHQSKHHVTTQAVAGPCHYSAYIYLATGTQRHRLRDVFGQTA